MKDVVHLKSTRQARKSHPTQKNGPMPTVIMGATAPAAGAEKGEGDSGSLPSAAGEAGVQSSLAPVPATLPREADSPSFSPMQPMQPREPDGSPADGHTGQELLCPSAAPPLQLLQTPSSAMLQTKPSSKHSQTPGVGGAERDAGADRRSAHGSSSHIQIPVAAGAAGAAGASSGVGGALPRAVAQLDAQRSEERALRAFKMGKLLEGLQEVR